MSQPREKAHTVARGSSPLDHDLAAPAKKGQWSIKWQLAKTQLEKMSFLKENFMRRITTELCITYMFMLKLMLHVVIVGP